MAFLLNLPIPLLHHSISPSLHQSIFTLNTSLIQPSTPQHLAMCQITQITCPLCSGNQIDEIQCHRADDTSYRTERCIYFDGWKLETMSPDDCLRCEAMAAAVKRAEEKEEKERLKKEAEEGLKRSKSFKGFLARVFNWEGRGKVSWAGSRWSEILFNVVLS